MDEYKKWAALYFEAFEGRTLYPTLKTWHWYGLACGSIAVVYLALYLAAHPSPPPVGRTAVIALAACALAAMFVAIDTFKEKAALSAAQAEFGPGCATLVDCRIAALRSICGVEPNKFASLAKECSDLQTLQRSHRLPEELNIGYYGRKIYDPESKGRLLTIVMGSLALFTAMLMRSLPPDYPSILEVLADNGVWKFIWIVVSVSVMLFGLWLAGQAMTLMAVTKTTLWWAKLPGRAHRSDVALRYFLRDLIRFHRPSANSEPVLAPPMTVAKVTADHDKAGTSRTLAERALSKRTGDLRDAA